MTCVNVPISIRRSIVQINVQTYMTTIVQIALTISEIRRVCPQIYILIFYLLGLQERPAPKSQRALEGALLKATHKPTRRPSPKTLPQQARFI